MAKEQFQFMGRLRDFSFAEEKTASQDWWQSIEDPFNFIDYRHYPLTTPGSRLAVNATTTGIEPEVGFDALHVLSWAGTAPGFMIAPFALPFLLSPTGKHCGNYLESYPFGCKSWRDNFAVSVSFTDIDTLLAELEGPEASFLLGGSNFFPYQDGYIFVQGIWFAAIVPQNVQFEVTAQGIKAKIKARGKLGVAMADSAGVAYERAQRVLKYDIASLKEKGKKFWENILVHLPDPHIESESLRLKYIEAWWTLLGNLVAPYGKFSRYGIYSDEAHRTAYDGDQPCFSAGLSHLDLELAKEGVRLLLDNQLPNGRLPDYIMEHKCAYGVTKPPFIHLTAWLIYQRSKDISFVKEIYPKLKKHIDWWLNERGDKHGLPLYTDSRDSIADYNARFDKGLPLQACDLWTHLVTALSMLSYYAKELGKEDEATKFMKQAVDLKRTGMKFYYDKKEQFFFDCFQDKRIPLKTGFHLVPYSLMEKSKARESYYRHISGPSLNTPYPLPTVDRSHIGYEPHNKRGCIRPIVNWLAMYHLAQAGLVEEAKELAKRTVEMIAKNRHIRLRYHPETGEGMEEHLSSWTAATFIESILGAPWANKEERWPKV